MVKFEFDRFATLALCSLPYAGMGALIYYCRRRRSKNEGRSGISVDDLNDLNDDIEITPLMRKALLVHFSYFLFCPILIEAFPDAPGLDILIGPSPPSPNNIMHMITCLAAENFFVTSTALGMILLQEDSKVPRWALMTPFAQLAWNLKNHVSWFFMAKTFAPEGPLLFALADMSIIWPICGIYGYQFLYGGQTIAGNQDDDDDKKED
mmetsp:Transcript_36838/g.89255  ORF Transcript_36838/g.89255 Transcript_36838/m.89255 type:complete len:208 (-) Transcript_36838:1047-1670(-)